MYYTERERNTTVNFTNIDDEDFTGSFGSDEEIVGRLDDGKPILEKKPIEYFIKRGDTKQFPMPLAEHFAGHLADKIMMKKYPETPFTHENAIRKGIIEQILGAVAVKPIEPIATPVETVVEPQAEAEQPFAELAAKKQGRPAKVKTEV